MSYFVMRSVAILSFLFILSELLIAKETQKSIDDLVSSSDWIFVGKIDYVGKDVVISDVYGSASVINIDVISPICGVPFAIGLEKNKLQLKYYPSHIERPAFLSDEFYVFFWKNAEGGSVLVSQQFGALAVHSNFVNSKNIADVEKDISLPEFTKLIDCGKTRESID